MVTVGKRSAELGLESAVEHRPVLAAYSPSGLRLARRLAALAMLGCYLGWVATRAQSDLWPAAVSAIAVAVAVARYGRMADRGYAGEPERLLLHDRLLQMCALLWLLTFVSGHA
jgi:decaprenyl-phosphate phosphoribosyltransferase